MYILQILSLDFTVIFRQFKIPELSVNLQTEKKSPETGGVILQEGPSGRNQFFWVPYMYLWGYLFVFLVPPVCICRTPICIVVLPFCIVGAPICICGGSGHVPMLPMIKS